MTGAFCFGSVSTDRAARRNPELSWDFDRLTSSVQIAANVGPQRPEMGRRSGIVPASSTLLRLGQQIVQADQVPLRYRPDLRHLGPSREFKPMVKYHPLHGPLNLRQVRIVGHLGEDLLTKCVEDLCQIRE